MDGPVLVWFVLLVATFTPLLSGGEIVDVRLVNGPSRYEGTVEYTTDNNTWQTTCGSNFDFDDARFVCEHIGSFGTNMAIADSPFGSDLDPPTTFFICQTGHTNISECGLIFSCSSPNMVGAAICYDDTYLGCYTDMANNRVLPGDPLQDNSTMTIQKCINHCRESTMADYVYAGVDYGNKCYCGVAGTNYSRLGAAMYGYRECHIQCAGDLYSSCGGSSRIAVFNSSTHAPGCTTPDDALLSSTIPAVTGPVGNTSNLGVAGGAGGGAAGLVIILVVIIVVVVIYKRRHGRAARKGPLPDQPPDKVDAHNYDGILMDSTLGTGKPGPPQPYVDSVNYAVVNKEPQGNMGLAKDEEDLSASYDVSTKHRPEPEGADLGDLYAMPDKGKKSHVTHNGASKAMEPSTQEITPPATDALYAMPDKKKKAPTTRTVQIW